MSAENCDLETHGDMVTWSYGHMVIRSLLQTSGAVQNHKVMVIPHTQIHLQKVEQVTGGYKAAYGLIFLGFYIIVTLCIYI